MTRERALEIIAAYGGDPARWPADEAIAMRAMAAGDAGVAAAIVDARGLDGLLSVWAAPVPARRFDAATLIPGPTTVTAAPVVASSRRGWFAGGAIAAAAAGVLLLAPGIRQPTMAPAVQQVAVAAPASQIVARMPAAVVANRPVMTADAGSAASAPPTARSAAATGPANGIDAEFFATVFTPTVDEDELI